MKERASDFDQVTLKRKRCIEGEDLKMHVKVRVEEANDDQEPSKRSGCIER